ncbi:MAG: pseudaminic acid synthase [Bacteroidetes bacterium]|nr:pseudaminic acid synthase [Bacteroidota bacterium]
MEIQIGNKKIGGNNRPFIIAEMSGNHNQSIERAMEIVDAAADAGADAIKLQTYTPDTITMKGVYEINDKDSLWNGKELYDLYGQAQTPWEWHKPIFERAKERNIIAFSSPFDESAVDFLENLNVPAYKIASFENTHHPLLKKVASTGKPVIISTGASKISDIDDAVRVLKENGCDKIILLKCTSTYPATPENTNILTIPHMSQLFECPVGISDHTMGIGVSIAAVAVGASVIEKHFTLLRADGGVDSAFSIEPDELKQLVIETERAFLSLGKISYGVTEVEKNNLSFKRSIYVSKDILEGEMFTNHNLKIIRPGFGIEPKFLDIVINTKAKKILKAGQPLTWIDLL